MLDEFLKGKVQGLGIQFVQQGPESRQSVERPRGHGFFILRDDHRLPQRHLPLPGEVTKLLDGFVTDASGRDIQNTLQCRVIAPGQ